MDNSDIEEIFAGLGAVTIKRLFAGKGIYHRGLIVGALMHGEVLLKADRETAPQFRAAGCSQWTYQFRSGKTVDMPYWSFPVDAFDDPDLRVTWVRLAFAAARRSAA
ncbi:MAG: TfoX family protein [Acetobacteraceae bacterium]|nr:TfoX family protein [Acetobacteraceae bacterium]